MHPLHLRRLTYITGLGAVAALVAAILAAAVTFSDATGATYSVLNRNISALGEPDFTRRAGIFNWGLQVGGILLVGFVVGLAGYVRHPAMTLVALAGIPAAGGVALVGIFPVTAPDYHKLAALLTFLGGLATLAIFTVTLLVTEQARLAKWLVLPSGFGVVVSGLFLLLPVWWSAEAYLLLFTGPVDSELPSLWLPALLEWLVFAALIGWVLAICSHLLRHRLGADETQPAPSLSSRFEVKAREEFSAGLPMLGEPQGQHTP